MLPPAPPVPVAPPLDVPVGAPPLPELDALAPDVLAPDVLAPDVLAPDVLAPDAVVPDVLVPDVDPPVPAPLHVPMALVVELQVCPCGHPFPPVPRHPAMQVDDGPQTSPLVVLPQSESERQPTHTPVVVSQIGVGAPHIALLEHWPMSTTVGGAPAALPFPSVTQVVSGEPSIPAAWSVPWLATLPVAPAFTVTSKVTTLWAPTARLPPCDAVAPAPRRAVIVRVAATYSA
jgi:hypothetical protein